MSDKLVICCFFFYDANNTFSSAEKSVVVFLCLSKKVNTKMCFSSLRAQPLEHLACPLAKGLGAVHGLDRAGRCRGRETISTQ